MRDFLIIVPLLISLLLHSFDKIHILIPDWFMPADVVTDYTITGHSKACIGSFAG